MVGPTGHATIRQSCGIMKRGCRCCMRKSTYLLLDVACEISAALAKPPNARWRTSAARTIVHRMPSCTGETTCVGLHAHIQIDPSWPGEVAGGRGRSHLDGEPRADGDAE